MQATNVSANFSRGSQRLKEDEAAFFLLEEVAEVFLEVCGDFVQGAEGRRSFIGLEEGDEFGGEAEGEVNKSLRGEQGVRKGRRVALSDPGRGN